MISSIHSTTVLVSDQEKALDFYTNTLGFEKGIDTQMGPEMRYLTVVPPGATTMLVLGHESWGSMGAGKQTGISFVTPDIDQTYETLSARGVTFKGPPEMMPWGQKATWFSDPDGNEFFISNEMPND